MTKYNFVKRNKLITIFVSTAMFTVLDANQVKADNINNKDNYKYNKTDTNTDNKINKAQNQLKTVLSDIEKTDKKVSDLSKKCDSYQEKIDKNKKSKQDAVEELAVLEKEENDTKSLLDPMNVDYQEAEKQYQNLLDEKDKLSETINNRKNTIKDAKEQLAKKKDQLKDTESQLEKLTSELNSLLNETGILQIRNQRDNYVYRLEVIEPQKKKGIEDNLELAKKELEEAKENYEKVKDDDSIPEKRKNFIFSIIKTKSDKVKDFDKDFANYEININAIKNTIARFNESIEKQMTPKMKEMQAEEDELKNKKDQFQSELTQLQEKVYELGDFVDNTNWAEVDGNIQSAHDKVTEIAQKIDVQQNKLANIEQQIDGKKALITDFDVTGNSLNKELANLQLEKEQGARHLQVLNKEKNNLQDLIEILQRYQAVVPDAKEDTQPADKGSEKPEKTQPTDKKDEPKAEEKDPEKKGENKENTKDQEKIPAKKKDNQSSNNDKNWIIIFQKESQQKSETAKTAEVKAKTAKTVKTEEKIKISEVKMVKGQLWVKVNQKWHKVSSKQTKNLFKNKYKFKATGKVNVKTSIYNKNGKKLRKTVKAGKKIKFSQIKLINSQLMVKISAQNKWLPLAKVSFN